MSLVTNPEVDKIDYVALNIYFVRKVSRSCPIIQRTLIPIGNNRVLDKKHCLRDSTSFYSQTLFFQNRPLPHFPARKNVCLYR